MSTLTPQRLEAAYQKALAALLAERHPDGYWVGELSTSALSTAVAVMALHLMRNSVADPEKADALTQGGLRWLVAHQNDDGGWGDTVKSFSNLSTTMLCRAALYLTGAVERRTDCQSVLRNGTDCQSVLRNGTDCQSVLQTSIEKAERWLGERYGTAPEVLAEAVRARYGKDRTFAVPILTTCALAGLISWKEVPPLPFELACFPQSWFRFLRLHVVSYALPALIAIGQCIYRHHPPRNPLTRLARRFAIRKSLAVLEKIQPANGGFLEATPLTSFVTLSLAACGLEKHPVAQKGIDFIMKSVRPDGSWPIDTNLSTWVTTLSINALAAAGELGSLDRKEELRDWLLKQQHRERHPYTGAAPGGWAWTPLPGGVPDADDTAGALLALVELNAAMQHSPQPLAEVKIGELRFAKSGLDWLLGLQNLDGGIPTFCRGWGRLPFDRSGSDLTAHACRALYRWGVKTQWKLYKTFWTLNPDGPADSLGLEHAAEYLAKHQLPDGSWIPLWFGNQHAPDDINPTYGTARVLAAYRDLDMMNSEPARKGIAWLLANQNDDGGWGGCKGTPSSVEETALAVEVLLDATPQAADAVNKGLAWLVEQVEAGGLHHPTPIGFYFAKLWYFEKLYPIIFAVAALGRARSVLAASPWVTSHGDADDS